MPPAAEFATRLTVAARLATGRDALAGRFMLEPKWLRMEYFMLYRNFCFRAVGVGFSSLCRPIAASLFVLAASSQTWGAICVHMRVWISLRRNGPLVAVATVSARGTLISLVNEVSAPRYSGASSRQVAGG